jgi:hypothetical protein
LSARSRLFRKLFGYRPFTPEQDLERKKFFAAIIASSAIIEICCIMISMGMIVTFSGEHRFIFDFGYQYSSSSKDYIFDPQMLATALLLQLVVAIIGDLISSLLEDFQKLPISEYFFHFRSGDTVMAHFSGLLLAMCWNFESFMTIPNTSVCFSLDPCTCDKFPLYVHACIDQVKNNTLTSSNYSFDKQDSLIPIVTVCSVLAVLTLIVIGLWVWKQRWAAKVKVGGSTHNISVVTEDNRRINLLKDIASEGLVQRSSLQQAIAAIEVLLLLCIYTFLIYFRL